MAILKLLQNIDRLGVRVQIKENAFIIDLHIVVLYGVNISAVVRSIMNKALLLVGPRHSCHAKTIYNSITHQADKKIVRYINVI